LRMQSGLSEEKIRAFQEAIIDWYSRYGDRQLPWRNTRGPWAVLVAAFLLRKTTTKQVVRVYEELLRRYPTPSDLLSASIDEVREIIRPLGIEHQRSRHLIEVARIVVNSFGGKVPCSEAELRKLPGVGRYVAAEVLLAACGEPKPLLDRNMARVIKRVFGAKPAKRREHEDEAMWRLAEMLVPQSPEEARSFNYGVLDLARKICTAKNPKCHACPVKDICLEYASARRS